MKKIFIAFLLLVVLSNFAFSQNHSSLAYQKLADSLFIHHHYPDATFYYEKALKNSDETGKIMLQIAKCYVKVNKIEDAYQWFEKAKANGALSRNSDKYEYIRVLKILKKRKEAENELRVILKEYPNDLYAREALDDIQNFRKYYIDSTAYHVESISINTPSSEFGPAYYKDGIVFSSSQVGNSSKKKYHWDNSNFLNLYFTRRITGQNFEKPVMFEEELDTRYHDGPATFYNNFEKMVVNRNRSFKTIGKEDTWLWHLALYDGIKSKDKNAWQFSALPFDEPPYSFAHPFISEDGTVLYFVSDKPGGYGGTDIYKVIHSNGAWGKPFNLGPTINTPENEVFPFLVNNTLYFASSGHGGLGGLDIFKSVSTVNGFTPPVNLASPLNSSADDFSFIVEPTYTTGYFSSARNGNDDLFAFKKLAGMVAIAAHVYDGETKQPLVKADVQIITATGQDLKLTTDSLGLVHFDLPQESGYVIIANKDDKIGMLSGFVDPDEKDLHPSIVQQVPSYSDTTRVASTGVINDEYGQAQINATISVKDETTGQVLGEIKKGSVVNFMAKKGHVYTVEAKNEKGDTAVYKLVIAKNDSGTKSWTMVVKKPRLSMAVRAVRADNNLPVAGAEIKIKTFSGLDQEFIANENGLVEFSLPKGTAYLANGVKEGLMGTHSGIAESGMEKDAIVHPIIMREQRTVSVAARITDVNGEVITGAKAIVIEKSTGEKKQVEVKDGLLSFLGEPGRDYVVTVEHDSYQTASEEISIPTDAKDLQKISFALEANKYAMAVRVFKASDQSPLSQAVVKIITFAEKDQEFIANNDGVAAFSLADKTPFIAIGDKDGYTGLYSGVVKKDTNPVYPIAAQNDPANQLVVVGTISDKNGSVVKNAIVRVTENSTGAQVTAQTQDGLLSFMGEKGKTYSITVEHNDYQSATKEITIPVQSNKTERLDFALDKKSGTVSTLAMAARIFKVTDRLPLSGAQVKIITFAEKDQELVADHAGIVNFTFPEGTPFVLIGDKNGYTGMFSGTVEKGKERKFIIHPVAAYNDPENQLPVVANIINKNGKMLDGARVVVIEKSTQREIPVQVNKGVMSFMGEKGKDYVVTVEHNDYHTKTEQISIPVQAIDPKKATFSLDEKNSIPSDPNTIIVVKDDKKVKFYVTSKESLEEIIERDSTLYLEGEHQSKALGRGSLTKLEADPNAMIISLGISANRIVTMENIYFDYNKAQLGDAGKQQLDKAKDVLQNYPLLQLMIGAHADSRGADKYNLELSKKRAKAITEYLAKQGVESNRVLTRAYGESVPAVLCTTPACSEEEYQRNRRAEFGIRSTTAKASTETVAVPNDQIVPTEIKPNDVRSTIYEVFEKYGDKKIENIVFKLSIGAYRYNHTLTFDELKDLGSVESSHIEGITYYFLGDYATLNSAKDVRQQVIKRGVKDAVISFFYKGDKIDYSTFLSLLQ